MSPKKETKGSQALTIFMILLIVFALSALYFRLTGSLL